jgi:hypothetical protein
MHQRGEGTVSAHFVVAYSRPRSRRCRERGPSTPTRRNCRRRATALFSPYFHHVSDPARIASAALPAPHGRIHFGSGCVADGPGFMKLR